MRIEDKGRCISCFHHLPDGWCGNRHKITEDDYSCNDYQYMHKWRYKR